MRIALKDNQVWRTRGGDEVLLKCVVGVRNYFQSYNPRTEERWVYNNGPDGLSGEHERQTFTSPSTEDLVELVSEA